MGVAITRSTFFKNVRKDFKDQFKSREFNLTHKKTDNPVYKKFELEVVKYFNKKNRTGCFGFQFISLSAEEVRQRKEFKDVELLKELEFSINWTRRVAKNNNLLLTSRKSDATYFTESQLENMRVGVSLQMSGFDSLHIINTDETPLY